MIRRAQWKAFLDHPAVEWSIFALGLLLILLSPLAGVIPGPGGLLIFAIGLAMVLRTSMWAKRRYVRFKRWQPKAGAWADWGMRRQSHRRREALRKQREQDACPPAHGIERTDDPLPSSGFEVAPIDPTPAESTPAQAAGAPSNR